MKSKLGTDYLIKLMHSYKVSYLLFYAFDKGLFDYFKEENGIDEVCKKTEVKSVEKIKIMLNIFVGIGLLEKRNEKYRLKKEVCDLLISDSRESVINLFRLEKFMMQKYNTYDNLVNALESNDSCDNLNCKDKEGMENTYGFAMENGGRFASLQVARMFRKYVDKKNPNILDIGGSKGNYSIAVKKCIPESQIDIFERKEMRQSCQENIKKHNLEESIKFYNIDIINEDVSKKYDGILLSNVLHLYNKEAIEKIIEKCSNLLNEGGILIIHDFFLDNTHTQPIVPLLFTIDWLLIGADFNYSVQDMKKICGDLNMSLEDKKAYSNIPTSILVFKKIEC